MNSVEELLQCMNALEARVRALENPPCKHERDIYSIKDGKREYQCGKCGEVIPGEEATEWEKAHERRVANPHSINEDAI
jgi:hypothetical protein